jgi:serine/threonine protein kinase
MHTHTYTHIHTQPSNLLLNSDCQIKLADYGLARSVSQLNASEVRERGGQGHSYCCKCKLLCSECMHARGVLVPAHCLRGKGGVEVSTKPLSRISQQ